MRSWSYLAILIMVAGCSGNLENLQRQMTDMTVRLDAVQRTGAAMRHRLESVEDQVLLLEDEVETQRYAGMRRSTGHFSEAPTTLPVVKVVPDVSALDLPKPILEQRSEADLTDLSDSFAQVGDAYQQIDESGQVMGATTSDKRKGSRKKDIPMVKVTPKGDKNDETGPLDAYRTAYEMYKEGRVDEARRAFEEFVKKHPRHAYADNAQYWVGECRYDRRDYDGALKEFMRVVTEHPDGNKVPDAMVKVGLSYAMLDRPEEARRMYDAVMLTYPESQAAAVAMRLLGEMP